MDSPPGSPRNARRRRRSSAAAPTDEAFEYDSESEGEEDQESSSYPLLRLLSRHATTLLVSLCCAAVLAAQPATHRQPSLDVVAGLALVCASAVLVLLPTICALCVSQLEALHRRGGVPAALPTLRRLSVVSLDGLAAVACLLILLLPLLAGTPTPVTVLMDGVSSLSVPGMAAAASWPSFNAGDVLLCSARRPLNSGEWVLYKDVGGMAALRASNSSTAVGRLLHFVICGGVGRGGAEACAASLMREGGMSAPVNASAADGEASHAMLLRQKRALSVHRGAVRLDRCPENITGGECVLVPVSALLASVQVRIPRLAMPGVPVFRLKRRLLAARPPQPRFAEALGARAQQHGFVQRFLAPAIARRDEVARLEAQAGRCAEARQAADLAQQALSQASMFSRGKAGRDAAAANVLAEAACAGLDRISR